MKTIFKIFTTYLSIFLMVSLLSAQSVSPGPVFFFIKARSVSIFLDACFSGESRSKEMLIAGVRPLSIRIENPLLANDNSVVLTASNGSQDSPTYPEKNHGLFTYFLLKGLKGEARGEDKHLTIDELYNYVHKNVSETAGYLDKEQTPGIVGKRSERVLVEF